METKLAKINKIAKEKPKERFTSLVHHINEESLKASHRLMAGKKAAGVDRVTKKDYAQKLDTNISGLMGRLKREAYKPQPVRRVYIEKAGSLKKRPLGIAAYEDKLVQRAMVPILNAIYEADFLNHSFGFRPGRSAHDALKVLTHIIEKRPVGYVVDVDIKGFFDHVSHDWMMMFLEHRIADKKLLRLIQRFLKAGIVEEGQWQETTVGAAQGGSISPILANVYLHYVLDLWFDKIYRKRAKGKCWLVRYCDDFVGCFEEEEDAKQFLVDLKERLAKFNLSISEEKTRILRFGRTAQTDCKRDGQDKPETFDFLGFTHYCSRSKQGKFLMKRKTSAKKMRASLSKTKDWFRKNLNTPAVQVMKKLRIKLMGYYRYYGITYNRNATSEFADQLKKQLYTWMNRRSQGKHFNWDKFNLFLRKFPLPRPKCYVSVFDVKPEYIANL